MVRIRLALLFVAGCGSEATVSPPDASPSPDGALDARAADAPAGPDAPSGAGTDVWVNPQLGTDDRQHGGAPGSAAFRTITFALHRGLATIHLDSGTYSESSGEVFPLVLHGDQALVGTTDLTSHISGNSSLDTNPQFYAAIVLAGQANRVASVEVTTTGANADRSPACVAITTSGPHVVTGSSLRGCAVAIDFSGQSGATISAVVTGDVAQSTAGNCLSQVGDDVRVESFSCRASNDWVLVCGARFTGCNTQVLGPVAGCSVDANAFAVPCK
jgi:hypothetical protein